MVLGEAQPLLALPREGAASVSWHLWARVFAPYAHTSIMDETQMLLLLPEQPPVAGLPSHWSHCRPWEGKHSEASQNVLQTRYGETTSSSSETESLSWHDGGTVKQTRQQHRSWTQARAFQATCKKFTDSLMTPPGQSRTPGLCAFQKMCCRRSVSELIWIKPAPPAPCWSGIAVDLMEC